MYLLFDIGGTKTRLAVSPDGKAFSDPKIIDTPSDFEEGMELLRKTCKELCKDKKLQAIAGGIRGTLDRKKEKLIQEHKLTQWVGKPIKSRLSVELGAPVYLETDTAMVGLGEAVSGAGRGFDIVAYITVSTGVGGARIVEKKIDENVFGFSPGHQIIDADGTICPECKALEDDASLGHLEAHISGTAVEKRFGKKPYEITDEKFWDEMARLLAFGLNNTIVHWSPDVVVLGGSMMKKIGIPIDRVKFHLKKILKIFPELPEIKKAELGDLGGLHGALYYLKQVHK